LTHAFVAGDSLWLDARRAVPVGACNADTLGAAAPSAGCAAFLGASQKATLQWALEAAFQRFEAAELASLH
jgi:adenosine deaminase